MGGHETMTKKKSEKKKTLVKKQGTSIEKSSIDMETAFPLSENMEGVDNPRLPEYKIIHAGGMFEDPGSEGDGIKKVVGVIIDKNRTNAYWSKAMGEGDSQIPDCYSYDNLVPDSAVENKMSDFCATCPKNTFGSGGPKRKACKNAWRIHILVDGDVIPSRITLPPSSLNIFKDYLTLLTKKGLHCSTVATEFSLEKVEKNGYKFSVVKFKNLYPVPEDKLSEIIKLRNTFKTQMRTEVITTSELGEENENEKNTEDDPF